MHVGLGLWNSIPATLIVEGIMFVPDALLYASWDRIGTVRLWAVGAPYSQIAPSNATRGVDPPN
jgi:hypothetical protein